MTQIIEIIVAPDGTSTVQTRGFVGNTCRAASRFIEQALGQRADEKLTAEFYQAHSVQQSQKQQT